MANRAAAIRRVLVIELVANLVVAAAKGVFGLWSGSLSILADSVHSLVDAAANVVGFFLIGVASAPPDEDHPYGHRKVEVMAAGVLGILIAGTALSFGIDAIKALWFGRAAPTLSFIGYIVIGGTLVVNIAVALWERQQARRLRSSYLHADAAHTASDVLVTTFVLAAYVASQYGWAWADPAGAIVVLVVVARVAWGIMAHNLSVLMDTAAINADAIKKVVIEHPDVVDCHRVRSRGPADAIHLDLHLALDAQMTLERAHAIAHEVEDRLRGEFSGVIDIVIHTEPDGDEPEPL